MTDDGRAFFDSTDQLVMRDTNAKLDAYEWKEGDLSLISTGFSNAPSSLLRSRATATTRSSSPVRCWSRTTTTARR